MKQFIKDYFTFNKKERRGVFVLLSIIVLLLLFLIFYDDFVEVKPVDFSSFEKEIAAYDSVNKSDSVDVFYDSPKKISSPAYTLFPFDPNNLPAEKWRELGLSEKQVKIIKKYESKGGKFYKKEDLKKIYGISPRQYEKLEPYITIAAPEKFKSKDSSSFNKFPRKRNDVIVEINSSDSTLLVSINGIGPVLANRILKYRNSLGGFHKKEQLLEVYGIIPEIYDKVSPRIILEEGKIKKLNINTATVNDLKAHPYFKYNIANALINYRNQHGKYQNIEDIKKIVIISEELYLKLKPYLTIE